MVKKILCVITLMFALVCLLASCAKNNQAEHSETPPSEELTPVWIEPEASVGLIYNLLDDNTYEVLDLGSCLDDDIVIPDEYESKKVSSIASTAFKNSQIRSITFLGKLNSIKADAFEDCEALERVTILNISDWFNIDFENYYSNPLYYAENLYIKGEEFCYFDDVFPDGITSIPEYVFCGANIYSVKIPSSVTEIEAYAFYEADIQELHVPTSVKKMGHGAFGGIYGRVNSVYIDDLISWNSVEFMDGGNPLKSSSAFYVAHAKIENLVIPNSITKINDYVFCGAPIKSLALHDKVTYIGKSAFYCSNIERLTIPESVTYIGEMAFRSTRISYLKFLGTSQCEIIDSQAFGFCDALTEVTIPASVKVINSAFITCTNLKNITFEENSKCERLEGQAFGSCPIYSIVIPQSVKFIDGSAFYNCDELLGIYFEDTAGWRNEYGKKIDSDFIGNSSRMVGYFVLGFVPEDLIKN